MKKKNAPNKAKSVKQKLSNTELNAQRKRLLEALREAGNDGITTVQARHELNIMAPAPRVFELRHDYGHNIQTIRTNGHTPEGFPHNFARYVLMPGKYKGVA